MADVGMIINCAYRDGTGGDPIVAFAWKLSPCRRVFPEKLRVTHLVNKFLALYGTRRFITVVTTTHPFSAVLVVPKFPTPFP
jgi:hypothetical protein